MTLEFRITNTSLTLRATDIAFADELPAELVVADGASSGRATNTTEPLTASVDDVIVGLLGALAIAHPGSTQGRYAYRLI